MKKAISKASTIVFLVALTLVLLMMSIVYARVENGADSTNRLSTQAYYQSKTVEKTGRNFKNLENYITSKTFDALPATYEMEIQIPTGSTTSVGTIYGNYRNDYTWCDEGVSFMVNAKGQPRIYLDNGATAYDIIFNANVMTGEWVHLAFTIDPTTGKAECFVNGASVGTDDALKGVTLKEEIYSQRGFMIGGDYTKLNDEYFKGKIASIALFTDVRSKSEILSDSQSGVATTEEGLLALYDIDSLENETIVDKSGNGYDVTERTYLSGSEYTRVDDFAYSFAVVGDTQRMSELYADGLNGMYDWIVANAETEKIKFVFGMGDVTEQSKVTEWTRAKNAVDKLKTAKIPYLITRGNHDMKSDNPNDSSRKGINSVFGIDGGYMAQFEGFYKDGDMTNSWRTFTVGETNYLFLTLDYGASDDMLAWADGVLTAHPNHKVIVSTHTYLHSNGKRLGEIAGRGPIPTSENDYDYSKNPNNTVIRDYNNGNDMWNELFKKHGNIYMILSGHVSPENHEIISLQEYGIHGNLVTSLLINPQLPDELYSSLGMVALLKFSEDGSKMAVEYYSTVKQKYFSHLSQFSLDLSTDEYTDHEIGRYQLDKQATCETNATKKGTCSVCGETSVIEIEGTAHGHAVETYSPSKGATCIRNAKESGNCKICGETITREIPNTALGHDFGLYPCKEVKCSRCTTVSSPQVDHCWGSGKITKPATETERGEMTYTCICGETKTTSINKLKITTEKDRVASSASTINAVSENSATTGIVVVVALVALTSLTAFAVAKLNKNGKEN